MARGMLKSYENSSVSNRTMDVLTQTKLLASQIATSDYLDDTSLENINAQIEQLSAIYDGRVLVVDRSFHIVADSYNLDDGKIIISKDVIGSFKGQEISDYDKKNSYIKVSVPIIASSSKVMGVLAVSVSTNIFEITKYDMQSINYIILAASALIIIIFAVWLSARLASPMRKMARELGSFRMGVAGAKISEGGYIEARDIAVAANQLIDNMNVLDSSRQEFVSNVSHELRTPLTSMKLLADSLVTQEDVPVELYQEFMTDIAKEIDRESQIISDLLTLVKMDRQEGTIDIQSVSINDLLELIMKRLRPIAEKQNVELVLESFRPVTAEVDEVKLTLALSNLIENAIKYNETEGFVHVSLNSDHQYFFVKVEDSGMGIPEDSIDHIFERFYRADKSHSREIGGTGLGLAIARSSVLMHHGTIKVHSVLGEGSTFVVRIPLNYVNVPLN